MNIILLQHNKIFNTLINVLFEYVHPLINLRKTHVSKIGRSKKEKIAKTSRIIQGKVTYVLQ